MVTQLPGTPATERGLDMAYAAEVTLVPSGLAQLTWVDPFIFRNKNSSAYDGVFVYYYNNNTDSLQQIETCAMRKDHQLFFDMSIFKDGDEIHFWVFLKSTLTGVVSESSYAGSVMISALHGQSITNKIYDKDEIMPIAITALNLAFQSLLVHTYNAAVMSKYVRYMPVETIVPITPETCKRLQGFTDKITAAMLPCFIDMGNCIIEIASLQDFTPPELFQDEYTLREAKSIFDEFGSDFGIPESRAESMRNLSSALEINKKFIFIIIQLIKYGEIDFGLKLTQQIHYKKLQFCDENYYLYEADKNLKPLKTLYYAVQQYSELIDLYSLLGLRNAG